LIPDPVVRLAALIQVAWGGFVACVVWALRHRVRQLSDKPGLVIAWITLTVLVANPRLAVYDLCLGSIPFIALSIELYRGDRRLSVAYGAFLLADFIGCGFHFEPNFPILAIGLAWLFGAIVLMTATLEAREISHMRRVVLK